MNTEERAQPTREEEWDAFLADLEEIAAHTAQQGDKRMNFEQYRPAPEIAPGFYHIPKELNGTPWMPDLLQGGCEQPEPVAIVDGLGGHFLLLKPEPPYQMIGSRYLAGYSTFLFELGGGGYVNIYLNPDASGDDNSRPIRALAYESKEAAFAAMFRQAEVDLERGASKKVTDHA